jgi:hypothetical protein
MRRVEQIKGRYLSVALKWQEIEGKGISLSDMAAIMQDPKTTIYRHLNQLVQAGWMRKEKRLYYPILPEEREQVKGWKGACRIMRIQINSVMLKNNCKPELIAEINKTIELVVKAVK